MRFEVTPCFVRIWFVVPFFNCVSKDTLRMVFPMLMSCESVSGVPWASANVVYLCILLKIFATGSSHHGCIGVGVRWLVLRESSGR